MSNLEQVKLHYTHPFNGELVMESVPVEEVFDSIAALNYVGVGDMHWYLPTGEVNGTLNVVCTVTGNRYKVTGDLDELLLSMGIFTNGVYKLKDTEITTNGGESLVNRVS